MHINLAYGTREIPIDVPDNWINGRCYRPRRLDPCPDPYAELHAVLTAMADHGLAEICAGKKNCVVAVDSESPILGSELLGNLLEIIEDASDLKPEDFTILITNRLWEPHGEKDLERLIDPALMAHYRVMIHRPEDETNLVDLGTTSRKIPLLLNKTYVEADLKVLLGAVKPDLLFGFSGGRSLIMPGLAGSTTIRSMYDFNHIADRNARFGHYRDNPFHMTGVEATNAAGCDLAVSAILTLDGAIHKVFAGHFGKSHFEAMNHLLDSMRLPVKEPMDIVVTSGGGHPYDGTLDALIETLSSAEAVLKHDGTIVVAAALGNGLGNEEFTELLRAHRTIKEALATLSRTRDQSPTTWKAQKLYTILQDHEIILYNTDLDEDLIWGIGLTPSHDMNEAILGAMESHGQRCKIVALPEGPFGIGEIVGGTNSR